MAIEIEITADIQGAIKAFRNGEISLDDLGDKLSDAGDAGKDAGKDIEKGGEDAVDSLDEISDASGKVGGSLNKIGGIAKDAISGDLGGALDGVAQSVGGLAAVVPGVGTALGVLASEGIGAIASALSETQKAADEAKARIAAMYEKAAADGKTFIEQAQIDSEVLNIMFADDQTAYNQAKSDASTLGLTAIELVRAQAGDQDALNHVLQVTVDKQQAHVDALNSATTPMETRAELNSREAQVVDGIAAKYGGIQTTLDENNLKAQEYLDYQNQSTAAVGRTADALDRLPREIPVAFVPDTSGIDAALGPRTVRVNLIDQYGRGVK